MSAREEALELMRHHYKIEVAFGKPLAQIDAELTTALEAVIHEFRTQFDVPGIRYWEYRPLAQMPLFFTTRPGEPVPIKYPAKECVELHRHEYLSRQTIRNYEDDSL